MSAARTREENLAIVREHRGDVSARSQVEASLRHHLTADEAYTDAALALMAEEFERITARHDWSSPRAVQTQAGRAA